MDDRSPMRRERCQRKQQYGLRDIAKEMAESGPAPQTPVPVTAGPQSPTFSVSSTIVLGGILAERVANDGVLAPCEGGAVDLRSKKQVRFVASSAHGGVESADAFPSITTQATRTAPSKSESPPESVLRIW